VNEVGRSRASPYLLDRETEHCSVSYSQVSVIQGQVSVGLARGLRIGAESFGFCHLVREARRCALATEIETELATIDLGDERLNKRAGRVLQSFWADPQASINAASQGWAETQAAYRFFDNDQVRPEALLEPHQAATLERIAGHPVVLLAQDTTELDYSAHPPGGAGPLTSEKRLGFLDHSQVAFTPGGLCLGVVEVKIWARVEEGFGNSKQRQYDPLETKETYRWLEGYRRACEVARQVPGTQIVSVADREGDLYELFVEAQAQGDAAADYVIRAGKDRSLPEARASGAGYEKLRETLDAAELIAVRELELPATPKRQARTARLEIRRQRVRLKAPYRQHVKLPEVEVNVVLVRELDPPPDVEPVEWFLVTSLPIDTPEQVLRVVDYYTGRWPIEIFFRVLKTGCQVERIQLETAPRLMRCLMLYKIVAWRVLYLTMLGRECPHLPCDVLFTADEWMPVWKITRPKKPLPKTPPDLATFLLLVAKLGGHNGRRHDGPPGPQALWTGIRRLTDFALAWRAFGPKQHHSPETSDTCE
jgi:hypothetical protein